jgi:hypothetical protein
MDEAAQNPPVDAGMQVEVELVSQSGESERLAFTLVPDEQADFAAGFLGAGTPLGKALWGKRAGEVLAYTAGDVRSVKVLSVAISARSPGEDVAARREAVIRDAVAHADFINAMIFASAVNTKWGDYDADGLDPSKWIDEKDKPDKPDEDVMRE